MWGFVSFKIFALIVRISGEVVFCPTLASNHLTLELLWWFPTWSLQSTLCMLSSFIHRVNL